jgi:hypothetical protein
LIPSIEKNTEIAISGIPLDFFAAVVFLIAGPAVGYTLCQVQEMFFTAIWRKAKLRNLEEEKNIFRRNYQLSDVERKYLDEAEARYYFNTSTCLVFLLFGIYFSVTHDGLTLQWASIPLLALAGIFLGELGSHGGGIIIFSLIYCQRIIKRRQTP